MGQEWRNTASLPLLPRTGMCRCREPGDLLLHHLLTSSETWESYSLSGPGAMPSAPSASLEVGPGVPGGQAGPHPHPQVLTFVSPSLKEDIKVDINAAG